MLRLRLLSCNVRPVKGAVRSVLSRPELGPAALRAPGADYGSVRAASAAVSAVRPWRRRLGRPAAERLARDDPAGPSHSADAPMPIVGIGTALVILAANGSAIASRTSENAPASDTALASSSMAAHCSILRPWVLKPPITLMD